MDDASDSVNKICLYGILFIGGGGFIIGEMYEFFSIS